MAVQYKQECRCHRPMPAMSDPLCDHPLAMAYVPWQHFNSVYEPDCALKNGTIFPELNKPFLGKRGCCG